MEPIPQALTPIRPFPVEGKGSHSLLPFDGEDTGGVYKARSLIFSNEYTRFTKVLFKNLRNLRALRGESAFQNLRRLRRTLSIVV